MLPTNAVFSTVIKADKSKQETWLQVASSGDLDLVINNHVLTAASPSVATEKRLPHLPADATSQTNSAGKMRNAAQTNPNVKGSPFLSAVLQAYDISHWIRRGPNVIVATVRSDHIPASLFLNGFLIKNGSEVTRFATTSNWQLGDNPEAKQGTGGQHRLRSEKMGLHLGATCHRNWHGLKIIRVLSRFSDPGPSWESLSWRSLPCGWLPLR